MIKDLAKKLTTFTQFKEFVIIELEFRRGTFQKSAEILKSHSAMVLIRVCSPEAEILVKMIRPRKKISPALGCKVQSSEKIWKIFTASEILAFAEIVDDKNPIHRLNPPIVPAFLILETLCEEFAMNFIKLKFKNFIIAGESLTLHGSENKFEIYGAGEQKVLMTFD